MQGSVSVKEQAVARKIAIKTAQMAAAAAEKEEPQPTKMTAEKKRT